MRAVPAAEHLRPAGDGRRERDTRVNRARSGGPQLRAIRLVEQPCGSGVAHQRISKGAVAAGPPTCLASAKTTVPARSSKDLSRFSCYEPRVVPHGSCVGVTRLRRSETADSWDSNRSRTCLRCWHAARRTQEVEKRSDAPDTSAHRAHRLLAASACSRDVHPVVSSASSSERIPRTETRSACKHRKR